MPLRLGSALAVTPHIFGDLSRQLLLLWVPRAWLCWGRGRLSATGSVVVGPVCHNWAGVCARSSLTSASLRPAVTWSSQQKVPVVCQCALPSASLSFLICKTGVFLVRLLTGLCAKSLQ